MADVTEEMLMAYADGELDAVGTAAVEAALADDPALARRLEGHRGLRSRLHGTYAPVAEEPVPERLLNLLSREPAQVVDLSAVRARREAPQQGRQPLRWGGALAACLVAGVMAGMLMPRPQQGLVGADLAARGPLAGALDKQLASNPDPKAAVKVGLTFRTPAEDYCRTFSAKALAGVACREDRGWKVRMAVSQDAAAPSDFRTAASGTHPSVLAAVEQMIDGEPLDAAAEARARKAGWR